MARDGVARKAEQGRTVPQTEQRWRAGANFHPPKVNVAFFFHQSANIVKFTHRDAPRGEDEVASVGRFIERLAKGVHGIGDGRISNRSMTCPFNESCKTKGIGFVNFAMLEWLSRRFQFIAR